MDDDDKVILFIAGGLFLRWLYVRAQKQNQVVAQEAPALPASDNADSSPQIIEIPAESTYISPNQAPEKTPTPETATPTATEVTVPSIQHSPDYRTVTLNGQRYELTLNQARTVQHLYEALEAGTPEVHQDVLLEGLDIYSKRLRDVFKTNPGAFKAMFGKGQRKGTYYLKINKP